MKTNTESKQDIKAANGHRNNGWFMPEPSDGERYAHARRRADSYRAQNIPLYYIQAAQNGWEDVATPGEGGLEEVTPEATECSSNGREAADVLPVDGDNGQPDDHKDSGQGESNPRSSIGPGRTTCRSIPWSV